ncbi:GNAT family N-acetyltransferase [Agromyces archimandritae]|uniref:GNAT family N-acetyltransferase n=1 Tax=Agromyces archimandritae TaxID=2781962 RepID=A0A975IR97_9MICO|nr:GNAT family protein [Agromyces archimandritae]QTX05856.1 GNAT family N-acetyltransferase [Agromyces archimandritae]
MTATRPAVRALAGTRVRLAPLTADELPELWTAIGRPEVFAGGYGGGPSGLPADLDGFRRFASGYYRDDETGTSWGIRLVGGPDDGALVGTSTLGDFDLANEGAHIGWTAYDPRVWGTVVNAETKLLLLGAAFDHGFERVKIQADSINERSRAAIAKLGARFEGVIRHERRRPDGSWRDTAIYSVLSEEWPAVRAGLDARLAAWGDRPVALG